LREEGLFVGFSEKPFERRFQNGESQKMEKKSKKIKNKSKIMKKY
jgi:hypothetical protein